MRRLTVVAAVPTALFVLAATGCGGIDQGKLESAIEKQATEQLRTRGSDLTVSRVTCSKGRDDYHFVCRIIADNGSSVRVNASCDHDGHCRWRRP